VAVAQTIACLDFFGPEMTANALRDWCRFSGAGSAYIPWSHLQVLKMQLKRQPPE
jgi:hypothetical protein